MRLRLWYRSRLHYHLFVKQDGKHLFAKEREREKKKTRLHLCYVRVLHDIIYRICWIFPWCAHVHVKIPTQWYLVMSHVQWDYDAASYCYNGPEICRTLSLIIKPRIYIMWVQLDANTLKHFLLHCPYSRIIWIYRTWPLRLDQRGSLQQDNGSS